MTPDQFSEALGERIKRIKELCEGGNSQQYFQAASLAQAILHDTVGGSHPVMAALQDALKAADWQRCRGLSRSVLDLYAAGGLRSPRLVIAGEIEGDLLDIAQAQVQSGETNTDINQRSVQLAVAAFLAGAALEDAMRRIADARAVSYDAQRTSISKLQAALFQPSKQIEIITRSENKQITTWGDTRNKADHGHFQDITITEVHTMILGVRSFIQKHLS